MDYLRDLICSMIEFWYKEKYSLQQVINYHQISFLHCMENELIERFVTLVWAIYIYNINIYICVCVCMHMFIYVKLEPPWSPWSPFCKRHKQQSIIWYNDDSPLTRICVTQPRWVMPTCFRRVDVIVPISWHFYGRVSPCSPLLSSILSSIKYYL